MRITDLKAAADAAHRARRAADRRQHLRDPVLPAPLRARRGHRLPLHDEVPERPQRHGRRHRAAARTTTLAERLQFIQNTAGAVPGPHRLLARAARHEDAAPPHAAPRRERPAGGGLAREAARRRAGDLSRPREPPAARARQGADVRLRRHDLRGHGHQGEGATPCCVARESFRSPNRWEGWRVSISHPATMTHASVPPEQRAALGITEGLVRLSCGVRTLADSAGRRRADPSPSSDPEQTMAARKVLTQIAPSRGNIPPTAPRSTPCAPSPASTSSCARSWASIGERGVRQLFTANAVRVGPRQRPKLDALYTEVLDDDGLARAPRAVRRADADRQRDGRRLRQAVHRDQQRRARAPRRRTSGA